MKFIKAFNEHSEYETWVNSNNYIEPSLSICKKQKEAHFNSLKNYLYDYFTIEALEDGTISFTYPYDINTYYGEKIEYSIDNGKTWVSTNNSDEDVIITINVLSGDKILWKGINDTFGMQEEWFESAHFSSTCKCNVMGNIMSLLYGDNFRDKTILINNYTFMGLFCDLMDYDNIYCDIVNAKNLILPATTLSTYCYYGMFAGCTALTTAPELPATTLTYNCYNSMFHGCTALTTAPELHATTLTDNCYTAMFCYCTSLTTAPELPATTLTYYCYDSMFNGCTSLNYIKAMFTTTPSTRYTNYWVNNVAATGTFVKNSAAEWDITGINGIPTGWTVETVSE